MAGHRGWIAIAGAVLVAVIAAALVAQSAGQQGAGPAVPVPAGGDARRFAIATEPLGDRRVGALVVDAETMRLLVYAFDFNKLQLKLVAVRDISQDVRLSHSWKWRQIDPHGEEGKA